MKTRKQILVGATILVSSFLNAQTITLPLNQGGNFDGGTIFSVDVGNASYTALAFEGKIETHEEGISPGDPVPTANSGLTFEDSDNSLYIISKSGARSTGSTEGDGIIFKYDITTKTTKIIKKMMDDQQGLNVFGGLSKVNGKYYGVTANGGQFGFGVIFSIDIATDEYVVEHSFNGTTDGGNPTCQLYASGNVLYGAGSRTNGTAGEVYFSFDASTSAYSVLHTSTSTATHDVAGIFERNGWLYFSRYGGIKKLDLNDLANGITDYYIPSGTGGSKAYDFTQIVNDWYVIFEEGGSLSEGIIGKFNFGNSDIDIIHNFQGGTGFGGSPRTKIVDGPQSQIYGTALGTNDGYVLYASNTDGSNYHILHDFTSQTEGLKITASPVYSHVEFLLYGISERYGANGSGTIWSYNLGNGTFTIEAQLGFNEGKSPLNGLSLNPNNNEYGFVTFQGGSVKGTLNSLENANNQSLTTGINDPIINSVYYKPFYYNSKTYLMVDFTQGANATYLSFNGIVEINESTGMVIGSPIPIAPVADIPTRIGTIVQGNIIQDGSIIYGVSTQYLWKIDLSTSAYTTLHTFNTSPEGNTPQSIILEGNVLYGINNEGGANSSGTVFKYDLGTSTFSVIDDTPATDSYQGLVFDQDGLYTAKTTATVNTIAYLGLIGGVPNFTDLITLNPAVNGSNPAPFIKEYNGFIYGVLNSGASSSLGGIFKYEIATNTLSQLISFDATTGHYSYNSEILVTDSPLSIDDLHSNLAVKVYPNPTNSIITIETELEINSIQLFNNIGQQVLEQKNNVIDISNLDSGIYFLKINSDKGFISKKIIKK